MISNNVYFGPLQTFAFSEQGSQVVSLIQDRVDGKEHGTFPVVFPTAIKTDTSLELARRLISAGFYPQVQGGKVVTFVQGLLGGDPTSVIELRDWSVPLIRKFTLGSRSDKVTSLIQVDSNTLASGSDDGTIKIWDLNSRTCTKTLSGHQGSVVVLGFLDDRKVLVSSCSKDKTAKVWNIKTGECLRTLNCGEISRSLLTRQGKLLIHNGKTFDILDVDNGQKTFHLENPYINGGFTSVEQDDGTILVGDTEGIIQCLNPSDGKLLKKWDTRDMYTKGDGHLADAYRIESLRKCDNDRYFLLSKGQIMMFSPKSGYISKFCDDFVGRANIGGVTVEGYYVRNMINLRDGEKYTNWYFTGRHFSEGTEFRAVTNDVGSVFIQLQNGMLAANGSGFSSDGITLWEGQSFQPKIDAVTSLQQQAKTLLPLCKKHPKSSSDAYMSHEIPEIEKRMKKADQLPPKTDRNALTYWLTVEGDRLKRDISTMERLLAIPLTKEEELQQRIDNMEAKSLEIEARNNSRFAAIESSFTQLKMDQEAKLEKELEAKQAQLSVDISEQQRKSFEEALEAALSAHQVNLEAATAEQMLLVQKEIEAKLGSQLQQEIQRVLQSNTFKNQIEELQVTVRNEIRTRQQQFEQELADVQRKIAAGGDMLQEHQAKKAKIEEQRALQSANQPVQVYYNGVEKFLSAKLMGAMMLVSDMFTRKQTSAEKVAQVSAVAVEKLCGIIPVVGQVVGSIASFGIQHVIGAVVARKEEDKRDNVFGGALRFKDAMAIAELTARRVTQKLDKEGALDLLTPEQANSATQRTADIIFKAFQDGRVKSMSGESIERKVEALVEIVIAAKDQIFPTQTASVTDGCCSLQ